MSGTTYTINRAVNRTLEFRGLKAQYIGWLAAALVAIMIGYAIAHILGVDQYTCLILGLALGSAAVIAALHLSRKYGEFGMMKTLAHRRSPREIRSRSRKLFITLKNGEWKRY